ncbi:hypothetical protein QFZ60_001270 [Arthrobacter sp. B2I5]|nr:hypothetical protein [Arthrobacter sp. B2I5]
MAVCRNNERPGLPGSRGMPSRLVLRGRTAATEGATEWRRTSQFAKTDGCLVAARVSTGQAPLVRGGDRESSLALFQYLDPTIQPSYLKTQTLQWGGTPDAPGKNVEVLALEQSAPGGRSTAVLARVFGAAQSSAYISVSCPDPATLASARGDVVRYLPLLPPSA